MLKIMWNHLKFVQKQYFKIKKFKKLPAIVLPYLMIYEEVAALKFLKPLV